MKYTESYSGVWKFDSGAPGATVAIFGGTHGDEVSGVAAVEKLLAELSSDTLELRKGVLVLVRSNEEAIRAGKRYLKHNLNRLFKDEYGEHIDRASYEFKRAEDLKRVLDESEYFLDLHSAPIAEEPFLITEAKPLQFFRNLGIRRVITGWAKFSSGLIGGDAENYVNNRGGLAATLESGAHRDPGAAEVAYCASRSVLFALDMTNACDGLHYHGKTDVYDMYGVQHKRADDFSYVGTPQNFTFFPKGSAFAYEMGKPLVVHEDSYLLIPLKPEETKIGEEICYLGRRIS